MPTLGEYSEVAICNMALAEIGRGMMLTSLDENSQAGRVCKLRYPYARDAVLRAFDWNFASKRKELAANETAPTFEYAYAYDLPSDCLQVRSVFDGEGDNWVVEAGQIITDLGPPIYIKYTSRVTDVTKFDALFVNCLASRIAADVAVSLSESVNRAQSLWQIYQAKLSEARRRDSQEGQPEWLPDGSWLDARF